MDNASGGDNLQGVTDFLSGGGEMGARMRSFDWSTTSLGPIERWPESLRTALSICLNSRFAMPIWWGPDCIQLYNDAFIPIMGGKHPEGLGKPGREVWPEIWDVIGTQLESVLATGEATWSTDLLLLLDRSGYVEETYFTYSYSPIRNETGKVCGAFTATSETTSKVISERRLGTLRDLGARAAEGKTAEEACHLAAETISANPSDIPFALIYLLNSNQEAHLAGASGLEPGLAASPRSVDLMRQEGQSDGWPLAEVARARQGVRVDDCVSRFGPLPGGPWKASPQSALVLPLAASGHEQLAGLLVVGVSPRRALDGDYRSFFDLVAGHISTAVANARAYEEERKRAEALAELDRAKTLFFSNVSHEFRTPLTLMLGPLEDMLAGADGHLPAEDQARAEIAHRNSLRLLKLVNTLLDFSRIEAGRVQASYEPTDLAAITIDLASVFRSAIERAGMRLDIDCRDLREPVYIDREMWEKVVLNLLSNAFKFTFEGGIEVRLEEAGGAARLTIRDTGIGIPAEEIPHLFERFHRVEGAHGRTYEGTGIGLALVQELVKLHGGSVRVESVYGRGSAFVIEIPFGHAHLPAEHIQAKRTLSSTALGANAYVEEALRWLPTDGTPAPAEGPVSKDVFEALQEARQAAEAGNRPRILLADDNADMRDYVRRLLSTRYEVEAVADGEAALTVARDRLPDLVLTDIMMPRLDGFGLLRALREDARTSVIPVIVLSARAGEESRVEGIEAGADDYLVKPFSARELLARVSTHLELARVRRETQKQIINIWESITDSFVALDREWRYIYINAEAERMGLNRAELLGKSIWEAFPGIQGTALETEFRRAMAGQGAVEFEYHYEPLGRWFEHKVFHSADGNLAVYFRDITERKLAEQALRESEERFAKAFNASPLVLTISSLRTGKLIEVNETFVNISGHPREQAIGKTTPELGLWARLQDREEEMQAVREAGQVRQAEYSFVKRNGEELVGLLSAERIEIGGEPCALTVIQDITDRKRAEEERERLFRSEQAARLEAEQAQRLSADLLEREQQARAHAEAANRTKDEFLATVSHELRTPLNAIFGWVSMLRGGKADENMLARGLETIERNSKAQARIIDDLLDVSRIITGKLRLDVQPVELWSVIQAAADIVRPAAAAKDIRLQLLLDPNAGPVSGDSQRLQQIVWNLLSNAVKFTPRNGRVQVRLERVNSHVKIIVSDTGQGISPEFLPYVFERFRQADSSYTRRHGGLGLGLAIVRHLVELHGGTVSAHSGGTDQGATFTVRLPLVIAQHTGRFSEIDSVGPEKSAAAVAILDRPARLDGLRLMLVEDEPDARDVVKIMLEKHGATVGVAASAAEGLRMLEELRPDVLISDIEMQDEDGYSLIRRVRSLGTEEAAVPAIALTAHARAEDRLRVLAAGFDAHVAKPVELVELTMVIASLTRRRKGA